MSAEIIVAPSIRELVELTGLTYASANKRLWLYRNGEIDRRGLLETREQVMRRKAANLWGIPDGGNAEWLALDDEHPHDERLDAIPGPTALERHWSGAMAASFDLTLSHCPVTCGRPTRMTAASFDRLCRKRRGTDERHVNKTTPGIIAGCKLCAGCDGRPAELEIINLEDLEMGKKQTGECAVCGANTAELRNTRGHMVCATCQKILSHVDNHPERIKAAARLLGKPEPTGAEDGDSAKAARAWTALMDRARDSGFAELADGDPEIMAATYIAAVSEVMAERDRLKEELDRARIEQDKALAAVSEKDEIIEEQEERLDALKVELDKAREIIAAKNRHIYADPATDPVNDALLEWALERVAAGKLAVRVQVTDMEERIREAEEQAA